MARAPWTTPLVEKQGRAKHGFCETNPPILEAQYRGVNYSSETYVICRGDLQVGSFWKTNPPEATRGGILSVAGPDIGFRRRENGGHGQRLQDEPRLTPRLQFGPRLATPATTDGRRHVVIILRQVAGGEYFLMNCRFPVTLTRNVVSHIVAQA